MVVLRILYQLSHRTRNPTICICENKDADQLCSNCTADHRLCFRYTDSTISLLLKSEISSFQPASVTVQADLSQTWSELQIVGFLMRRLNYGYKIPVRVNTFEPSRGKTNNVVFEQVRQKTGCTSTEKS